MTEITEKAVDKQFLRDVADHGYDLPASVDAFAFAKALLPNFASNDGELRDELSYMILAGGIIDKQKLSQEQLKILLDTALDKEHLFFHIGEVNTDAVFMRSFSNLIIAAILYNDARNPAFSAKTIQNTRETLLQYGRAEKDWRGYVEGKGWAHAIAHLADALDECAQHPHTDTAARKEILELISELARLPEALYTEEDVRLATVPFHIILGKQIDEDFLAAWVDSCYVPRDSDVTSWTRGTNAKNFLRSLYFLLHWAAIAPALTEHVANVLKKQDTIYLEER
jgi:Protein of unknown function (DUF2785)